MNRSIKAKLILIFILIISVPVSILGILSYKRSATVVYNGFLESNLELVKEVEYAVENFMKSYEMAVELFAKNNTTRTSTTNFVSKQMMMSGFQNFVDDHSDVLYVYMGTENKEMFDPSWLDVPDDYDPTSRSWYIHAKEAGETIWTEPYVDAESGNMVVSVATPVYNNIDKLIGVVSMDITTESLSKEMNAIKIGQKGYPVLIDSNLITITHKDPTIIGTEVPVPEIKAALEADDEGMLEYEYGKVDKFATFKKIESSGWSVLATMDQSEVSVLTKPIMTATVVLGIASLIIGFFVAILVARNFIKPIIALEKTMNKVKEGDLTVRADIISKDEIGRMAGIFNVMIDHFSDMLSKSRDVTQQVSISAEDLASTSEEVSASSDEVSKTIDEIAQGAGDQARETEKGAVLIGSLADKIVQLTDNSNTMSSAAENVSLANVKGLEVISELKVKTSENNASTLRIENAIKELEQKSTQIGGILETITSIASQTNLLALNASIEAARAGEHGRGFAVVADEIRKLAEGSSQAAENIQIIVKEIQDESKNTVTIMGEVKTRTDEQNIAVDSVDEVFENINNSTDDIAKLIKNVARFVVDMNTDKEQIVASIEEIAAVSEQSAAASEEVTASVTQQSEAIDEVAKSAEKLNMMADELQKEINRFKI